jgi:hypothetical protein
MFKLSNFQRRKVDQMQSNPSYSGDEVNLNKE